MESNLTNTFHIGKYPAVLREGFFNFKLPWGPSTQKVLQKVRVNTGG